MELETQRLKLIQLTTKQLHLWLESIPHLTEELECIYPGDMLEGNLKAAVSLQLERAKADSANAQWHTFWFILRKVDKMVLGAADFKNVPNEAGEVELGYGIGKAFEGQGYMTEAVPALCQWAKTQPGVQVVTAETLVDNADSQGVLKSCGFKEMTKGEKTIMWSI